MIKSLIIKYVYKKLVIKRIKRLSLINKYRLIKIFKYIEIWQHIIFFTTNNIFLDKKKFKSQSN